ncbi:MAG: putative transcriptional regulator [Anaerocolumna sp.]|nr:putative transcriptional regulator [Anaerocolumna sp.]
MSAQVTDLYDSEKEKYSLTLVAGENGLTNSVSWVYLAEDIQNMSFLKGGELVITTGLFTEREISLSDFIRGLVTHNCSGIILNVGKYIKPLDITDELLTFCNSSKVPLFTMPWEIHLVDIMQNYCRILLHNTQSMDQLNGAFQGALYQEPVHETILLTINQYGFTTITDYRMIVIQNLTNATRITFSLNRLKFQYHLFEHENRHILIYSVTSNGPSLNKIIDILLFCDSIKLGISSVIHSLTELSLSYKRARFSLAAAILWNITYSNFDDLGIFQVLFCASDPDILRDIYKQNLGVLEEFDMLHQSDYLNTLRVFLLSDCNLLETSGRMHTHRNTVIYRIKKIKELLHTELDNSKVKFDLLMAYYIKEYFSI